LDAVSVRSFLRSGRGRLLRWTSSSTASVTHSPSRRSRPGCTGSSQYAVEVNGVRYPVKQAFRVATGLDHFTTQRARDVLRRLGFFSGNAASADGYAASAPGSAPSAVTEPSPLWVLEIQTLAGGSHEFELDEEEDVQALEAEISHRIVERGFVSGA
jgi:hypothetical protein